jgi:hypothetical protein
VVLAKREIKPGSLHHAAFFEAISETENKLGYPLIGGTTAETDDKLIRSSLLLDPCFRKRLEYALVVEDKRMSRTAICMFRCAELAATASCAALCSMFAVSIALVTLASPAICDTAISPVAKMPRPDRMPSFIPIRSLRKRSMEAFPENGRKAARRRKVVAVRVLRFCLG